MSSTLIILALITACWPLSTTAHKMFVIGGITTKPPHKNHTETTTTKTDGIFGTDSLISRAAEGFYWESMKSLEVFDFETHTWNRSENIYNRMLNILFEGDKLNYVSALPARIVNPAAATQNGLVYATGRAHKNGTVYAFDPISNNWVQLAKMVEERGGHGLVEMQGKLYAIGGYNGTVSLSTVEAFDPEANQWSTIGRGMDTKRWLLGVGVLLNEIYAVGGCLSENSPSSLNSAEKMNPSTGVWSPIASMNVSRQGHCVAIINGKLYAAGGKNSQGYLKSAEVYNPLSDSWTSIADMSEVRGLGGCVVHNDQIYFVGGHNGTDLLSTIDVYNPSTNTWSTLEQKLEYRRRSFGIAYL